MALKWGWYSKEKCRAQDKFFDTPEQALEDMDRRHGTTLSLERLAELGFHLALVNVEITTVMIMDYQNER